MSKKSAFTFSSVPTIHRSRSKFPMSYKHLTSFNVGDLVPLYVQEVLPGDTFKVKTYNVIRTSTPFVRPVMDNLQFDMYYFFVPMRLVWNRTAEFFGENKKGYWVQTEELFVPKVTGEVFPNTIADYMGLCPFDYGDDGHYYEINLLPFRAYALIYNEWFRSENLQEPVYIDLDSTEFNYPMKFNDDEFGPDNYLGKLAKINKYHDYFTSCLPAPQKGDAVSLRFGDNARIDTIYHPVGDSDTLKVTGGLNAKMVDSGGDPVYLDLSKMAIANINDLRYAFALQNMLELDARGGTRFGERILTHFGVSNPDSRIQRPEFLGGASMPLNTQQVASTSQQDNSPVGTLGAYSLSNGVCGFNKGFTEYGFVIGVGAVRYKHTYSQGLERFMLQSNKTDYYDPVFAHIGEQPVYSYELDVRAVDFENRKNIFGYNEAWASYRYRPNRVSSLMRPSSNSGLDVYHFGDEYSNVPVLSSEFLKETNLFVNRTLSADSDIIPNLIGDFYHEVTAIRCLPTYSNPGLIDHVYK